MATLPNPYMDALYFPTIELPEGPALARVLLYWDCLRTIVPPDLDRPLSRSLRELMACDLVRTVNPERFAGPLEDFGDSFVAWVEGLDHERLRGRPTFRVHREKASMRLWEQLRRSGLVAEHEGAWVRLPGTVAYEYMAHLAAVLARLQDTPTEALTSRPVYWNALTSPPALRGERDTIRAVVLHDLLPTPTCAVAPQEIARFKEKNRHLLQSFRQAIEEQVDQCAALRGSEVRSFATREVNRRLRDQLIEVQARMVEARWTATAGAVAAAVVATPLVAEAVVRTDPFAATSATAVPLAEVVRRVVEKHRGNWRPNQPLAYAALAAETFGPDGPGRAVGRLRDYPTGP